MATPTKRTIQTVRVGSLDINVMVAPADHPELTGDDGVTDTAKGEILIRENLPPSAFLDTYIHELFGHAVYSQGLAELLSLVTGKTGEDLEKVEEAFIRVQTPTLMGALLSAGWKPPTVVAQIMRRKVPK